MPLNQVSNTVSLLRDDNSIPFISRYRKEATGNLDETLVLNVNNKLVQYLLTHSEGENVATVCEELYDLARIQQGPLKPDAMAKFVARTNEILGLLAKEE